MIVACAIALLAIPKDMRDELWGKLSQKLGVINNIERK